MNAETINNHLAAGGTVQVTTYLKSWIYQPRHVGMFFTDKDGTLRVKRGRSSDCLSFGDRLLVAIRLHK